MIEYLSYAEFITCPEINVVTFLDERVSSYGERNICYLVTSTVGEWKRNWQHVVTQTLAQLNFEINFTSVLSWRYK